MFFVGEFTHALDSKGRVTIPSKWRISGGENTYLALPNPGGYITVYPPKWWGVWRRKWQKPVSAMFGHRLYLWNCFQEGSFLWLRQAGSNQFERQIVGARGHTKQGCVGWELLGICNLVGRPLRKQGVCGSKEHF